MDGASGKRPRGKHSPRQRGARAACCARFAFAHVGTTSQTGHPTCRHPNCHETDDVNPPMIKAPWYQGRLWSGMGFVSWMRLLARNRFAVSFTRLPMALAITLLSVVNSLLRWLQRLLLG